ncbi:MAG: phosphoglucosamine mutase [Acidimicrobiales bacterium]
MSHARFGTDGIRGVANAELSPELVLALGRATARRLLATSFVVGRDTRRSGSMLQSAFSAGLAGEGADVVDVGILPTPAVAWLSSVRDIPGAVVSASHNPFADNGIKLFARGGAKLSVETEAAIEEELHQVLDPSVRGPRIPEGFGVGRLIREPEAAEAYAAHLVSLLEGRSLRGLRMVLDCANGAAAEIGARVYEEAGAEVMAIGCEPDGANINAGCGSTHIETLAGAVVEFGADLGLALDGDADRLLAVDASGAVVGGDELLALFAIDLGNRGQLAGNTVVVTVMTNLGFRMAMEVRGIAVKETAVGDRHVLAALDADGLAIGGEQSGHIIFRRLATTGDGLLTGLVLADLLIRSDKPLASMLDGLVTRVPQVLVNVPVPDIRLLEGADSVWSAVAEEETQLGENGRILLRPSGTEPLVRVMVEAVGDGVAEEIAQRLSALVHHELMAANVLNGQATAR